MVAVSLVCLAAMVVRHDAAGSALLHKVDRFCHPWQSFSVDVLIKAAGQESRWRVQTRANGDCRIDGLSEKEKGRSILILGDDMWLILPTTKRAIKVSPQQRLLGPAAGSDIARSRFAEDFQVREKRETTLEGKPCFHLLLNPVRRQAACREMALWMDAEGGHPLRAEYRLLSGKISRTVLYDTPVKENGVMVSPGLRIQGLKGAELRMTFSHWENGTIPDSLFVIPRAGH